MKREDTARAARRASRESNRSTCRWLALRPPGAARAPVASVGEERSRPRGLSVPAGQAARKGGARATGLGCQTPPALLPGGSALVGAGSRAAQLPPPSSARRCRKSVPPPRRTRCVHICAGFPAGVRWLPCGPLARRMKPCYDVPVTSPKTHPARSVTRPHKESFFWSIPSFGGLNREKAKTCYFSPCSFALRRGRHGNREPQSRRRIAMKYFFENSSNPNAIVAVAASYINWWGHGDNSLSVPAHGAVTTAPAMAPGASWPRLRRSAGKPRHPLPQRPARCRPHHRGHRQPRRLRPRLRWQVQPAGRRGGRFYLPKGGAVPADPRLPEQVGQRLLQGWGHRPHPRGRGTARFRQRSPVGPAHECRGGHPLRLQRRAGLKKTTDDATVVKS